MNPEIISAIFYAGIAGLFWLDSDRKAKTSKALWIAVTWFWIGGSRNVGEWLQSGGPRVDYGQSLIEGNPVDRNILTTLLVLGVIVLVKRKSRTRAFLQANKPLLAYLLYCVVSVLWSDFAFVGFKRWFRLAGDVVMVLIVLTDPDSLTAIKRVFRRTAFILIPLSLMFIRYFPDLGRAYGEDGTVYWTGVATGKNGLGAICLVFGLGSVWRFARVYQGLEGPRRFRRLLAHGILLGIAAWLFVIANSMTSLSCFVLASTIILATSLKFLSRRPALVNFLVASIITVAVSVLFLGLGGDVLRTIGRDPTLTGRTQIWSIVLRFVQNPLIGAGYEGFWLGDRLVQVARLHSSMTQAHNGYIEVYLNLGWIGLILLMTIIITGYRDIIAVFRNSPDLSRLRLALIAVALIYNCTEGAFKFMYPVWIAFLLAVMVVPKDTSRIDPANNLERTRTDAIDETKQRRETGGWEAPMPIGEWIASSFSFLLQNVTLISGLRLPHAISLKSS